MLAKAINTKMRYEQVIEELMSLCTSSEAPPLLAEAAKQILKQAKAPMEVKMN